MHLAGLFWAMIATLTASAAPVDESIARGIKAFEAAYRAWDAPRFRDAITDLETACKAAPESYPAHYWLGAARFHLLLQRLGDKVDPPGRKEKSRLLNEALTPLEQAVTLNPDSSEAHALVSTLMGMKIAAQPHLAPWLGRRVLEHRRLALEHGPSNPRTHYLIGLAYYHMPAIWGREDRGLEYFLEAERLFILEAASPRPPLEPTWGHGTCLTFIGRLYADSGKTRLAAEYLKRALVQNPEDRLAKECLEHLHETEQARGKR